MKSDDVIKGYVIESLKNTRGPAMDGYLLKRHVESDVFEIEGDDTPQLRPDHFDRLMNELVDDKQVVRCGTETRPMTDASGDIVEGECWVYRMPGDAEGVVRDW